MQPRDPRPTQLRGFPARLSLPTTMPAPTCLHPNPPVCPDRSILTLQLTSAYIHAAISASQPSCTCLATPPACAMPVHGEQQRTEAQARLP
eukprot:scaffold127861_cov30-Phaeocystis_antarctica.AAC.1